MIFYFLRLVRVLYIRVLEIRFVMRGGYYMKSKIRARIIPKLLITYGAILVYTLTYADISTVFSIFISWTILFSVVYMILEFDIIGRVGDFQEQLQKYCSGEQSSLFDLASDEFGDIVRKTDKIIKDAENKEEVLKKQMELYQSLVEDAPMLVVRYMPSGEVIFSNETYREYFNDEVFFNLQENHRGRENSVIELSQVNPTNSFVEVDSEGRHILWVNRVILDQYRRIEEYQSVGMDITEHKKFTWIYKKITDNQTDILFEFDLDGTCLFVSPSFTKTLGHSENVLSLCSVLDLIHECDRDLVVKSFRGCVNEKKNKSLELRVMDSKGRYLWFEANMSPYTVEEVTSLIISCREVTENVKNRALLEMFFNQSLCGAFISRHDPIIWNSNTNKEKELDRLKESGVIVKANKALADMYGISIEELESMKVKDLYSRFYSHFDLGAKDISQMIDHGSLYKIIEARKHSGEEIVLDGFISSIFDDLGRVVGSISLQKNITDKFRVQKEIEKNHDTLDFILRSTSDLLIKVTSKGQYKVIWSSDDFVLNEEGISDSFEDIYTLFDKELADRIMGSLEVCLREEKTQKVRYWVNTLKGRSLFDARLSKISDTEVMMVARDITIRESDPKKEGICTDKRESDSTKEKTYVAKRESDL